jgi:hypothetical protein
MAAPNKTGRSCEARIILAVVLLGGAAWCTSCTGGSGASRRDSAEGATASLQNLPMLTEEVENLRSLDVTMTMGTPESGAKFHYAYRRPGQFSMSMSGGGLTDAPFVFCAERKVLLCDPIHKVVVVVSDQTPPVLMAYADGDGFKINFGTGEGKFKETIHFDMAGLYKFSAGNAGSVKASRAPEGGELAWIVRAESKKDKGVFEFQVGHDAMYALASLLIKGDDGKDAVRLDPILVNQGVKNDDMLMPDLDVLGRYVKVERAETFSVARLGQFFQVAMTLMQGVMSQAPEDRAKWEKDLGEPVDWAAATAFAKRYEKGFAEARRARAAAARDTGRVASR